MTFAGCHGVRIDPEPFGRKCGVTDEDPVERLDVRIGLDPAAGPGGGAEAQWSVDVEVPGGGTQRQQAWRRADGSVLVAMGGRAAIDVDAGRRVAAVASTGEALALQLVTTFAAPLLAQRAGALVLHASATVRDGHAVLVAAESGTGKSTLMAALVAEGWAPLTEDLCAVTFASDGPPRAWPGPPWVRLPIGAEVSPGSGPAGEVGPGPEATRRPPVGIGAALFAAGDKTAWDISATQHRRAAEIARLILLLPPGDGPPAIAPVAPEAAIGALARHTPWFESGDRRGAALFGPVVRLVRAVPASQVRLRRSPTWSQEAVAVLEDLVAGR